MNYNHYGQPGHVPLIYWLQGMSPPLQQWLQNISQDIWQCLAGHRGYWHGGKWVGTVIVCDSVTVGTVRPPHPVHSGKVAWTYFNSHTKGKVSCVL